MLFSFSKVFLVDPRPRERPTLPSDFLIACCFFSYSGKCFMYSCSGGCLKKTRRRRLPTLPSDCLTLIGMDSLPRRSSDRFFGWKDLGFCLVADLNTLVHRYSLTSMKRLFPVVADLNNLLHHWRSSFSLTLTFWIQRRDIFWLLIWCDWKFFSDSLNSDIEHVDRTQYDDVQCLDIN